MQVAHSGFLFIRGESENQTEGGNKTQKWGVVEGGASAQPAEVPQLIEFNLKQWLPMLFLTVQAGRTVFFFLRSMSN